MSLLCYTAVWRVTAFLFPMFLRRHLKLEFYFLIEAECWAVGRGGEALGQTGWGVLQGRRAPFSTRWAYTQAVTVQWAHIKQIIKDYFYYFQYCEKEWPTGGPCLKWWKWESFSGEAPLKPRCEGCTGILQPESGLNALLAKGQHMQRPRGGKTLPSLDSCGIWNPCS